MEQILHQVYICLFDNGSLKVGRGKDASFRIKAHSSMAKNFGIKLVSSEIIDSINPIDSEIKIILWCKNRCSESFGNEWFKGVDFENCKIELNKIVELEVKPNKAEKPKVLPKYEINLDSNNGNFFEFINSKYATARDAYIKAHNPSKEFIDLLDQISSHIDKVRVNNKYENSPEWFQIIDAEGFESELFFASQQGEQEANKEFIDAIMRALTSAGEIAKSKIDR